jgi:hypothetical protein
MLALDRDALHGALRDTPFGPWVRGQVIIWAWSSPCLVIVWGWSSPCLVIVWGWSSAGMCGTLPRSASTWVG